MKKVIIPLFLTMFIANRWVIDWRLHFSTSHANSISCVWNTFERAFWSDSEGNKDTHEHLRYSITGEYKARAAKWLL